MDYKVEAKAPYFKGLLSQLIINKMKCPRCSSVAFYEDYGNGEWMMNCNVCGYHSSQFIEAWHGETPIFSPRTQSPLGVVVTTKGNIPYYTKEQKEKHLKDAKSKGFTFFDGVKWVYTKKEVLNPIPVHVFENEQQE